MKRNDPRHGLRVARSIADAQTEKALEALESSKASLYTNRIALADVPEEGRVRSTVVDGRPVALTRCDGRLGALENRCPHQGGPVGEGHEAHDRVRVSGVPAEHPVVEAVVQPDGVVRPHEERLRGREQAVARRETGGPGPRHVVGLVERQRQ